MNIYNYHRVTGEFLSRSEAQPDPLDDKNFLVPAAATLIAPPEVGIAEAAIYDEVADCWSLVPDLRGKTFYFKASGQRIVIQDIGQTPEEGWTDQVPFDPDCVWVSDHWELPLPTLGDRKQDEIDRGYEIGMQALLAGYTPSQLLTFDKQEAEARAYLADSGAVTPYLDAATEAREISKIELAGKIVAKADSFSAASGALTGKWQRLRDEIITHRDSGDGGSLAAINW